MIERIVGGVAATLIPVQALAYNPVLSPNQIYANSVQAAPQSQLEASCDISPQEARKLIPKAMPKPTAIFQVAAIKYSKDKKSATVAEYQLEGYAFNASIPLNPNQYFGREFDRLDMVEIYNFPFRAKAGTLFKIGTSDNEKIYLVYNPHLTRRLEVKCYKKWSLQALKDAVDTLNREMTGTQPSQKK